MDIDIIFKIAAVGLITAIISQILKKTDKDEIATLVTLAGLVIVLIMIINMIGQLFDTLAGGIVVVLSVVDYFADIFSVVSAIAKRAGLAASVVTLLFKVIAVGYITEFSASVIEDVGLSSLADKVTLAGKLIIVGVSLPVVVQLFEFIAGMLT